MKKRWQREGKTHRQFCATERASESGVRFRRKIERPDDGQVVWRELVELYKELRVLSKMSQSEVAERSGVDLDAVQKLENLDFETDAFAADRIFRTVGLELYVSPVTDRETMLPLPEFLQYISARFTNRGN
jgi:hypothetical protein